MNLRQEGYWEQHYKNELKNFEEDGDEGEIWFGKALSRKIVDWIIDRLRSASDCNGIKVVDVGCGNAFILCLLLEKYLKLQLDIVGVIKTVGLDYSANSIELSNKIIEAHGLSGKIALEQCDFLDFAQVNKVSRGETFDYIVDKGTFDAICLMSDDLEASKAKYIESLYSLTKPKTIFILASCNYTEEELLPLFERDCPLKRKSRLVDRIDTPTIQFGGKQGSQVTCLIIEFMDT